MRYIFFTLLSLTFITANAQFPDMRLEDFIYNDDIKTVLLYPGIEDKENPTRLISPPIIPIQSTFPLVLEFDDMTTNMTGLRAKIFSCNADWTKSNLNDIEFTYEYNDYPITTYEQSFSTKVPYTHYRFEVPKLKLSGNYVLMVYTDRGKKVLLTRKFMIYDTKVGITAQARFSQGIQQQFTDQQIDFSISYKGYNLISPQQDLKVFIRKNFRWDQVKTGFKPTNVQPFDQLLEYTFFNLENTFPGGNEFRYFDSRTLSGRGYGVYEIDRAADQTSLVITPDKSRSDNGYLQIEDLNGQYIVDQKESGRGSVEADYTPVLFTLKVAEDPDATFYVNGAYNLWQLNDRNKMEYNADAKAYQCQILIKQGVINYDYTTVRVGQKPDEGNIEGNYAVTENDYDILIYHRPPAGRSDLLIGYKTIEWNRRR
ncbi:DUF5103 domain-containing protein [Dyadobacter subterraneus]|uniref:DUF5103 domain-containing protein n=1 Tax=Dyadobacter subterraneus TaxID=2773304 RepID=A0ABR9W5P2_9BACT|nr:DUF5103 domain-containing protein [Dyadobacter subterraneus]MBE9460777.1 DUF5103 domain-containing protein [Dyadobacter subterraneus]